jgi:four helix bundle protein
MNPTNNHITTDKEQFIENLKRRTKKFAVDSIKFCDTLKACKASNVVTYQFIKSATSTGANYRSACRARSKAEFFSKICIVVEEIDESDYWLEIIRESELTNNLDSLNQLSTEAKELVKIMTTAKETLYKNEKNKY